MTSTTLLPVLAASASALGVAPTPLVVAGALAASCAFMPPIATPPNAIVFASGHLTRRQMARAGFALNIVAIVVVTLLVCLLSMAGYFTSNNGLEHAR